MDIYNDKIRHIKYSIMHQIGKIYFCMTVCPITDILSRFSALYI